MNHILRINSDQIRILRGFAKFILYADDSNIILTASTIEEVFEQLETSVKNLVEWVNGLALNLKKTKYIYMIFSLFRSIELPSSGKRKYLKN